MRNNKILNERLDATPELKQYIDFVEITDDYYMLMCNGYNKVLEVTNYSIFQMRELYINKMQYAIQTLIKVGISDTENLEMHLESLKIQQRKIYQIHEMIYNNKMSADKELSTRNWACTTFAAMIKCIKIELDRLSKILNNKGLSTNYQYEDSDYTESGAAKHVLDNDRFSNSLLERRHY